MKKLKIGIIGLGFVGTLHIDAIRRIPCADIIAVADSNLELAKSVSEEYGIPAYYNNIDDLIQYGRPDVIHDCTPNFLHKEINIKVIQNDIHLFSEKPLTRTAEEAEEVLKVLKQHPEVVAGVNHCYRLNPMDQEMYSMVQMQKIGVPRIVYGKYIQDYLSNESDYSWRIDPEISGPSRAIADIGIHFMDTIQFVLESRITDVCADLYTALPIRKKPKGQVATFSKNENTEYEEIKVTTEDYGAVLFKMDNGIHGVYCVSEISPGHGCGLSFEIDGNKASVAWNQEYPNQIKVGYREGGVLYMDRDPISISKRAKGYTRLAKGHPEGWNDAELNTIKKFYTFILDNKKIGNDKAEFATFEDAYYLLKIVKAILESNKKGSWVHI